MVAKQIRNIRPCHERALDRLQSNIAGVATWVYMFKKIPERPFEGGVMGVAHICGVILLILFLYSISLAVALIIVYKEDAIELGHDKTENPMTGKEIVKSEENYSFERFKLENGLMYNEPQGSSYHQGGGFDSYLEFFRF
ncbi:unnamed protein product [Arabidopsis lyrata]|nr:unnamed protein product [Arabidopsis lyrata]